MATLSVIKLHMKNYIYFIKTQMHCHLDYFCIQIIKKTTKNIKRWLCGFY